MCTIKASFTLHKDYDIIFSCKLHLNKKFWINLSLYSSLARCLILVTLVVHKTQQIPTFLYLYLEDEILNGQMASIYEGDVGITHSTAIS